MRFAVRIILLWALLLTAAHAQDMQAPYSASGCVFNSTLPVLANTHAGYIQCDQNGRLIMSPSASSGPSSTNVTQFGGNNVVTGTGVSGAGIPRVTFSNDSAIANTAFGISGTLPAFTSPPTFNQGSPAAIANAWPTYLSQGGNVLSATNPLFEQTVGPSMNAPGTSGTIARSVQGVANGVPIPVSQSGTWVVQSQYNSAPISLGAGSFYYTQIDQRGNLKNSETGSADPNVGITPDGNTGTNFCALGTPTTACIAKGAAGNLYGGYGTLSVAANAQTFLVALNMASLPASGATITPVDIATFSSNAIGAQASIDYKAGPPNAYSNGIVFVVTTSLTTYTPSANTLITARVR